MQNREAACKAWQRLSVYKHLHAKRLATAARVLCVWVLELEAAADERVAEVKIHAKEVEQGLRVTDELEAIVLHDCTHNLKSGLQWTLRRCCPGCAWWLYIYHTVHLAHSAHSSVT
jgi:hypothetical protein